MTKQPEQPEAKSVFTPPPAPLSGDSLIQIEIYLKQASAMAVRLGVPLDDFMRGAWAAFNQADPDAGLRRQLDEIRAMNRMGLA